MYSLFHITDQKEKLIDNQSNKVDRLILEENTPSDLKYEIMNTLNIILDSTNKAKETENAFDLSIRATQRGEGVSRSRVTTEQQ